MFNATHFHRFAYLQRFRNFSYLKKKKIKQIGINKLELLMAYTFAYLTKIGYQI